MNLPKDIFEAYKSDFQNGWVNVGNICDADCLFCSQKWNPPGVTKDLKRLLTMDEIKDLTEKSGIQKIGLINAGGRHTNNGEFFIHPQAIEILDFFKTKDMLTEYTKIFTNGMNVSEEHIKFIKKLNIGFSISLNSANVTIRKKIMGNSYAKNKNAIDMIGMLEKYDLDYQLFFVPLRSTLDNGDLENSIKFIKDTKAETIAIFRPGYTKLTPEPIAKELSIDDKELLEFASSMNERYKVKIFVVSFSQTEIQSKLLSLIENFLNTKNDLITKRKLFLCSESVKDIFPLVLETLKIPNSEIKVVNSGVFGGSVSSAGLLLVEDYICAVDEFLKEEGKRKPECLILPGVSFDINKEDISMISYKEIEKKCGIKVYIVPM